jgi:outer membrane protein TolC
MCWAWPLVCAGLGSTVLVTALPARAQPTLPAPRRADDRPGQRAPAADERNIPKATPLEGPDILPTDYPGLLDPAIPVALPDVLKLAMLANLDIAQANVVVQRARNAVLLATSRYLPSLTIGSTYVTHDGAIQATAGNIQEVNRDSLFAGQTTGLNVPFSEALFSPIEARQAHDAARFGQARVVQDTLLRVADAYFNLLLARRRLARADEAMDFLISERKDPLRGDIIGFLPLIKAFVESGTALPSDLERVKGEVVRLQGERARILEDVRTASADLSRLLHLNAGYFLLPVEDYRRPLKIPGQPWFEQTVECLVEQALRARPELAESQALLAAALTRYRSAKWQPLLPTLQTNYSWGGFGGGPPIVRRNNANVMGNSGSIAGFNTRSDFDISLFWRLEGAGVGTVGRIRDARLSKEQAELRQLVVQDAIVSDVVRALEQLHRSEQRVDIYRAGLFDEQNRPTGTIYRSLRLNFIRIYGGGGLPLELLDSIRRHSDVLDAYAISLTDYDRARFRLLLALGLPPESILDPSCMPLPACPPPECPPAKAATPPKDNGKADEKETPKKQADELPPPRTVPPAQNALPAPKAEPTGGQSLPPIGQAPAETGARVIPTHLPPPRYPATPAGR